MPNGISLHIGLNIIDPNHYGGWDGKLNACEFDAKDMNTIASLNGFASELLLSKQATRNSVIQKINNAAKNLGSGDIFYISYSGHGGQVPDINSDETDGQDETWCLYDGQMIDDELYGLWKKFNPGVRIIVLSDSCHSGTITKYVNLEKYLMELHYGPKVLPSEIAATTYFNNKLFYDDIQNEYTGKEIDEIKASVKLISGCMDNQLSYDGAFNGRFTGILKSVYNGGKFTGTYYDFYKTILNRFSTYPEQSPNYSNIGAQNSAFERQSPFVV